ncbi:hypothetical protein DNH61_00770 [Paenibacillus sambharensis]|uniref:Class I SAM-dependent methyltransferase n=1 Tax=Paenibacillus sambharensis TaxID=1803190 RepID=A0A2W1LSS7_9BACL|nr:class I SAM-dependent methyltransferase [Paenibacillus sambharensis]PZD97825.1 hypothetical protein DNH61_00770 [Paenibacillus sambharensis]
MNTAEKFKQAEALLREHDEQAIQAYEDLLEDPVAAALSSYRLGEIYNRRKNIAVSQKYHTQAFELQPQLAALLVPEDHPSHNYVYTPTNEQVVNQCTLCGNEQNELYACINTVTGLDFIPGFNPVRVWNRCPDCHHLFTSSYPMNLDELLTSTAFSFNLNPNSRLFPMISQIMTRIKEQTPGNRLLEVGVGAGEFSAVAKEFLFDVTGMDIRPVYAKRVSEMLGVPILTENFLHFEDNRGYDVICMGDVIEHMADPVTALKKAHSLLNDQGVLWLSTPNFESAFSLIHKDQDPMWRVVEHLNYFSYVSLRKLLEKIGFTVQHYSVSSHYNGSMELTCIKNEY